MKVVLHAAAATAVVAVAVILASPGDLWLAGASFHPGWIAVAVLAARYGIRGLFLGLGFLVAAQLASEGPRVRYTTQERSPLVETATELQAQQDGLKATILDLRERIQAAEQADAGSAAIVHQLNDELEDARWFPRTEMPVGPARHSIAGWIIRNFAGNPAT